MRISDWSSDVCSSDLGRPYRRNVAWHIVEAAVHLRAELIITVVGQHLEITRQSVARLELDSFGGQFARLGDDVVRQIEYTVPFLDVERRDRDQRVSFRFPFHPRLPLTSVLLLNFVPVT